MANNASGLRLRVRVQEMAPHLVSMPAVLHRNEAVLKGSSIEMKSENTLKSNE
jgi:hypothetical protein